MKLQDLLKDIELGKVYTDKDRKPFKVNEKASYKQIGTNKNDGYILHGKDIPVEEGKVNQSKVNQAFTRGVAAIRKISRKLNDDDNYAFIQKLEKWLK